MCKILIVEDDAEDQGFFLEAIHAIDPSYECHCASSGVEALDYLIGTDTLPAVILLDLNMPQLNGFEFMECIKQKPDFAAIPVFIFSELKWGKVMQHSQQLGAENFFSKPNTLPEWQDILEDVLSNTCC